MKEGIKKVIGLVSQNSCSPELVDERNAEIHLKQRSNQQLTMQFVSISTTCIYIIQNMCKLIDLKRKESKQCYEKMRQCYYIKQKRITT